MNKLACLLIIIVLCLSFNMPARPASAQAQTKPDQTKPAAQDPTIKVNTELVEVRAVVTDKQGHHIIGLKQEDFEVLENGKPQTVSFFSTGNIAGSESRPVVPGNTEPTKTSRERLSDAPVRTVVLFVDTLHLSPTSLLEVKQTLHRFIDEQLTEQDMVALVSSGGTLGLVEQFTRNRQILRYAIERLRLGPSARESFFTPYLAAQIERGDAEALNVGFEILKMEEHLTEQMDGAGFTTAARKMIEDMAKARAKQIIAETSYQRKSMLLTLKAVVERLSGMPGQRLIALLSDGFSLYEQGGVPNTDDLQATVSRAARAGVAIYSISAKGLQPPTIFSGSIRTPILNPHLHSYQSASEKDAENGLNALAKDTGGEAFFRTNDLGGALTKVFESNSAYYVLAYYPGDESANKQFRRFTIRVKNHPEYTIRAPKGYQPPDLAKAKKNEATLTPQQRLVEAMFAPLSQNDIGVSAAADYLESEMDRAQVSLRVYISGDKLAYREQNQQHGMSLELMTMIYDTQGVRVEAKSEFVTGNLPAKNLDLAKESGYTYARRVSLKPGLYQVRVGVRELNTEHMGTAVAWVEVPNLTQNSKLTLSGLMLLDAPTDDKVPATAVVNKPQGRTLQLSRMTEGIRFYLRGQVGTYFFRLYQGPKFSLEGLVMQTEFLQNSKSIAQSDWQPVTARQIGLDKKGIMVGGQIQFENLKPGIYELRVTVKDSASKRTAQRTVAFGIE